MIEERAETEEAFTALFDEAEPLESAVDALDGRVVVFARRRERVVTVVNLLADRDGPPTLLVVDSEATPILSRRLGWFEVTTRASDLVASGRLTIRETDLPAGTPTAIDARELTVLGTLIDRPVRFRHPVTDGVREGLAGLVREAEPFEPPLPGIDTITDGLASTFGPRVATDFTDAVETASRTRTDIDGLLVLLLVGATHRLRWNELRETAAELGLATANPLRERKAQLLGRGLIRERPETDYDGPGRPPKVLTLPDRLGVAPEDGVPDSLLRRVVSG